jgi:hypothetical protein
MPSEEAGYTYAVEPAAIDRLLANEEESIYDVQKSRNYFGSRHTADPHVAARSGDGSLH